MPHVFISYVRENSEEIRRLCNELTRHGVEIWLDQNDIAPGERWQRAIQQAIQKGAFFIACFSKEYNERDETYMNEELTLAIARLRRISPNRIWFIPVKLNQCEIPDRIIGGGETLKDIHWLNLYKDWDNGIRRILEVVGKIRKPEAIDVTPELGSKIRQILEAEYINNIKLYKNEDGETIIQYDEA